MRHVAYITLFVALVTLIPGSPSEAARAGLGAGSPVQTDAYRIVPVQYIDAGDGAVVKSTCHIINTSATENAYLTLFGALGPNGINDVVYSDPNIGGTILPPLGRLDIELEDLPTLAPDMTLYTYYNTTPSTAVLGWVGTGIDQVRFFVTVDYFNSGGQSSLYSPKEPSRHIIESSPIRFE